MGVRTVCEIESEKETIRRMIERRIDANQPSEAGE
jgi:ppGpp synthetase/RelA/SpoT-type nucleotidyltranferase